MKDLRSILLAGLLPKLEAVTGLKAYVRIPKGSGVSAPYIFVNEIYQTEDGPKTGFTYNIECKINIVYEAKSNIQLYTAMDNVLSFVNNRKPFDITGYEIQSCELISSNDEQSENPNGKTDITGQIRINFKIK